MIAQVTRLCCLVGLVCIWPQNLYGQIYPEDEIRLLAPLPKTVAIGKTPKITFQTSVDLQEDGRLFLLDGDDITALVSQENNVYTYTPVAPLGPGEHALYIAAYTVDGESIEKELQFASRHSQMFEGVTSNNTISSTIRTILTKSNSTSDAEESQPETDSPYTTFDNYLSSESRVQEGNWDSTLSVNARYIEQNSEITEPEKKGLSLLDFLIASNYTADKLNATLEIGDTTLEQSTNTIDYLTRRGGQTTVSFGDLTLSGFGVLGNESGDKIDGMGLNFNSNNHILGTAAEIALLDQQMSLKVIYAKGGEEDNSLGIWSEAVQRKGDVTGVVLTTDFFSQLFTTTFEFDGVNFDPDTGDDDGAAYDKAYRIHIGGLKEIYDYELSYIYSGPEYEVVGNQSIIKDWAGFDFNSGITYPEHAFRILGNYSWDNVEDVNLYARIYSLTGGFDYQFSGWEHFPLGLFLEYNKQNSKDEPIDASVTSLETFTVTGTAGYINGPWSMEITTSYSEQNDTTEYNYDTELFTATIVPSYTHDFFSILPSWSINSSIDKASDVRTDTNTLTLDIYSGFFEDTITCELGGTYDWTKADDDSVDTDNSALYGRLNYHVNGFWWLTDSTIALEYNYNHQKDEINDSDYSESLFYLVISTAIPVSY